MLSPVAVLSQYWNENDSTVSELAIPACLGEDQPFGVELRPGRIKTLHFCVVAKTPRYKVK
jgi:hypothetical protein